MTMVYEGIDEATATRVANAITRSMTKDQKELLVASLIRYQLLELHIISPEVTPRANVLADLAGITPESAQAYIEGADALLGVFPSGGWEDTLSTRVAWAALSGESLGDEVDIYLQG